jgi:hypothetical protein
MLVAHAVIGQTSRSRADGRQRVDEVAAAAVAGCAVVASILCFQAAAARLLPAMTGIAPPLALLAFGLQRYRR